MSIKQGRMSNRIHQILSQLLLREISDPRLRGVTVTEVRLDAELMYAKVYVSALGNEGREDEVMRAFRRAGGFLRREVGKRIRIRSTPRTPLLLGPYIGTRRTHQPDHLQPGHSGGSQSR